MDFDRLRYFVAVAEEQNITHAATRLGIQQPPLSQQIQRLETDLGVQLFQRKPRGVALTTAGSQLLRDAKKILQDIESTRDRVQRTARGQRGEIVIGFTSSAPFHPVVSTVFREYRRSYPGVSVTLREAGSATLVDEIRNERVDAAFIRSPSVIDESIYHYRLLDEPMIVAVPSDHPLARDPSPMPLSALQSEPFIIYRRQAAPGLFDAVIAACHAIGVTPKIDQASPRITSTLNLVAAGMGITVVPASLRQLNLSGLTYRPLRDAGALVAPLLLAVRKAENTPAPRAFIDLARQRASALSHTPLRTS